MECRICYETVTEEKILYLECTHSLCKICVGKLVKQICPFCRTEIKHNESTMNKKENNEYNIRANFEDIFLDTELLVPRQQRRRRRRRRSEIIQQEINIPIMLSVTDISQISEIIETPIGNVLHLKNKKTTKCDKKKQRFRSSGNRWKNSNHRNFSQIYKNIIK